MMSFADFTNRRILIAGASSGIGRETAVRLDELGAQVILLARREEKLKEVLSSLKTGGYYSVDLRDFDAIEDVFKEIQAKQGKLDGLVYSVGKSMSVPMNLFKPEKLKDLFSINFFAFVECVRQATKKGRYNEGMRIVGVSSISSLVGDKAHLGYSASKAAMDAAVRCMAKELAEKGICINNVAPAMTATEMYNEYIGKYGKDSESHETLLSRQYLGIAQTRDIANAIAFLLSPSARFITGITLPVDGGTTTS